MRCGRRPAERWRIWLTEGLGHLCLAVGAALVTRYLVHWFVTGRVPLEMHLGRWFSMPYVLWLLGVPFFAAGLLLTWRLAVSGRAGFLALPLAAGALAQAHWAATADRLAFWPLRWHLGWWP